MSSQGGPRTPRDGADLVIRRAALPRREGLLDLAVRDGVLVRVDEDLAGLPAARVLDVDGRLVTPPLVDAHIHLDSALTLGEPRHNRSGTLLEGIQIWEERKATLTAEEIRRNALTVLRWLVAHGTLHLRCHVDICEPELTALHVLLDVRAELAEYCDIQLVAFPQDGLLCHPDGERLLRRALELGCDVVGGIPHYEPSDELGVAHVQRVFALAREFDRDVDLHCDETDDPGSRFVETVVAETLRHGWQGRVVASHCTAMGSYSPAHLFRLSRWLRRARVGVVANPGVNLTLQGRFDTGPTRRGIAPLAALVEAGVTVGLGQDSVMDPWFPFGTGDLLAVAQLAALVGHLSGSDQLDTVLDMVTTSGAELLRLGDRYGLAEGRPADLVVLDARDTADALRRLPARLHVFRRGTELATTRPARTVLCGALAGEVDFQPPQRKSRAE
ncbi:cytosine deaminase [Streptoalloteichus tenebrarius]|uniref:Cytosine deaminase n=1 Tax=Streptoalloteichus tenebrarius (strain ATCC 17920 / DSM 40477 / JCM 4838 / CBS 697.72 / NBRC 16177 / NCIMB 11028 / NRRL B-12390 / A12253. 1 / ISP 5477) TaxID=1933 RepID=A0ABT1HRL6_STRSD|nr:cytosine deaminase [Streptoalloteichus tenebrarius]MCP2258164.1 cytosine deaminase [Streptoalloteichus tenebrarius]BFF04609.1 amidohydrolase family protein [Streptoalloteichus tenebrarius]